MMASAGNTLPALYGEVIMRYIYVLVAVWTVSCGESGATGDHNANNVNNTNVVNNSNSVNNTNNTNNTVGEWHEEGTFGAAIESGIVSSQEISESSGIAFSRVNPGLIWLHNDSGDGPRIFAIDSTGAYLGHLVLDGVWATDWEDIAVGNFEGISSIYVGDFGDNDAVRAGYTIHIIPEPVVDVAQGFGEMTITTFTTLDFTYGQDGPRNCEAMVVTPDEEIYLIEKALGSSASLWHLPPDAATATYAGEIALGLSELITGADLCEHGRTLALSSYGRISLFVLPEGEGMESATALSVAQQFPVNLMQLEAVALEPGEEHIWFVSEGTNQRLYFFPRE